MQEAYRKDVKRAFGVLQARYAIVRNPGRFWHQDDLSVIMLTVIILHNMTVEDESGTEYENLYDYDTIHQSSAQIVPEHTQNKDFNSFLLRYQALRSVDAHNHLKSNLIKHLWAKFRRKGGEQWV